MSKFEVSKHDVTFGVIGAGILASRKASQWNPSNHLIFRTISVLQQILETIGGWGAGSLSYLER